MESLSKTSTSNNDGIKDRLSEMPDQVIVHILSLMPTIDAVRTMLIQRFGNLWTLIPALSFDYDEYIGKRLVLYPAWIENCLEVFFMLMKSSVSLEELIIYAHEKDFDRELSCPGFTTCVMPLLKTASIHGNHCYKKWCQCQLHIIEFLLANAVVLEKFVINLSESKLTTVEELQLVEQVSRFRRVSTTVTVIFVEKHSRITSELR